MLYQPYPSNWPEFTPRDKLADWLELYASIQDLVVWTNAEFKGRPAYNPETNDWAVTITREGFEVILRPAHIVLATGTLGEPNIPDIPDMERFQGHVLHSCDYAGGAEFTGKRAVVVGAGNSSIDVCQDLFLRGAESVTMVQRSPTEVTDRDWEMVHRVEPLFPRGVPVEVSDFKLLSVPRGYIKKRMLGKEALEKYVAAQAPLHEKVKKAGVRLALDMPQILLTWERLGGTFLLIVGAGFQC